MFIVNNSVFFFDEDFRDGEGSVLRLCVDLERGGPCYSII
jgi:hypothetical protein